MKETVSAGARSVIIRRSEYAVYSMTPTNKKGKRMKTVSALYRRKHPSVTTGRPTNTIFFLSSYSTFPPICCASFSFLETNVSI